MMVYMCIYISVRIPITVKTDSFFVLSVLSHPVDNAGMLRAQQITEKEQERHRIEKREKEEAICTAQFRAARCVVYFFTTRYFD